MKRFLLLVAFCLTIFPSFTQTLHSQLKTKNKTLTAKIPASFIPIVINGQSQQKSAAPVVSPKQYPNLGLTSLNIKGSASNTNKIIYGKGSIAPIYYERTNSLRLKSAISQTAEQNCMDFLDNIKTGLRISDPKSSFRITAVTTDALGQQHFRLSQNYKGIKVYNSDLHVHFAGDREIFNGKYCVIGPDIKVIPAIAMEQALNTAINDLKSKFAVNDLTDTQKKFLEYAGPVIDTVIFEDLRSFNKYSLSYHIIIRPNLIDEWYYFINAADGTIIEKYNNTKYDGPATASAMDLNGVSRTVNTYLENGTYSMVDASEPMFDAAKNEGFILTVDAQNTAMTSYAGITTSNNIWNNSKAISAHYNAKQAYLYFKNTFGRNSINGSGGSIYSFINVTNPDGSGMDNAFWSNKFMAYGNGNIAFKPLAGGLDVAAHEMGHGVTAKAVGLEYKGESGAINESTSDIFGAMVDRSNWFIGESVTKTSYISTGHLRDMSDPHNGSVSGDPGWQPKHTSEMYLGSADNGGVHINSGICNYAYYLLATAISKEKAEQIYYRALTVYLTKSSQFIDLRIAVEQAAKDLYGDSTEVSKVKTAFDAVGIYEELPNNYVETYPVNPGQDYLLSYNTYPADSNSLYVSPTDGSSFLALSTTKMKGKVSVVDNGDFGLYVSMDNYIREITMYPSATSESVVTPDAMWENVAISKDGNRMAAISTMIDTSIYVYDFVSAKWAKYKLYNPSADGSYNNGGVLYADAIEFDHTGEYLIYDAYNIIKSTNADTIDYWDIGVIKVWDNQHNKFGDGTIAKVFSNLQDSLSVGNAVFSKNSPNIIAFDFILGNYYYGIMGLNLEHMDLGIITVNTTVGYPSFSKADDKIAYSALDNSSNPVIGVITLNPDKISSSVSPTLLITDAKWPVYYATGIRTLGFAPVANFAASYKSGKAPISISFFDQSTNEPTAWEWTFESGIPGTSTLQNPLIAYSTPGTYSVSLKATNTYGTNTVVKAGYVVISNATGIGEVTANNFMKIFPNPTSGMLSVSFTAELKSNYTIEVYDLLGHSLQKISRQKEVLNSDINLSKYANGIYILRIVSNGESQQFRILKQ